MNHAAELREGHDEAYRRYAEARERYHASLPHLPVWNLLPMGGGRQRSVPWECTWHGPVSDPLCAECHREHEEWLVSGTWKPGL